jgi:hypothetical protein
MMAKTILAALFAVILLVLIAVYGGFVTITTENENQTTNQTTTLAATSEGSALIEAVKKIALEYPNATIVSDENVILLLPSGDAVEFSKDGKWAGLLLKIGIEPAERSFFENTPACREEPMKGELCKVSGGNISDELKPLFPDGYVQKKTSVRNYLMQNKPVAIAAETTIEKPALIETQPTQTTINETSLLPVPSNETEAPQTSISPEELVTRRR